MPSNDQLYNSEEFAGLIRKKHPQQYDHWTDDKLTKKWLEQYPVYNKVVDIKPPTKEYDPDLGDHLNKAWYNFKSMGVEIPAATVGLVTSMLDEDSEVRESMLGFSEGLRGWAKDKQNEWIESDPGIQGYLEWQKDKPMSLKNFWHFDMMLRGVSDLAPSIATMMMGAGGVNLGLKAIGAGAKLLKYGTQAGSMVSMGALEGSGEYNEAMQYLVEEKGMKPNEALDTAANAAIAVGIGNGMLEYYGINRLAKLSGMGGKSAKKMLTTKMVDKLTDNKFLNKTGDVLTNAVVEGLTEGTQSINQELVQNVYKKYGGDVDLAFENFVEDFKHSAFSPETKESYFSALSGTLLMGGVGASTSTFSRRMLDNFKNKEADKNIIGDTKGIDQPSGLEERSKNGVNLAHITYGDQGITTDENPVLLEAKEDAGTQGNQYKNRIEASIDYVIENGQAAFDDNNVDRVDFIDQVIKDKELMNIDSGKIDKLTEVINQIEQVEINVEAEKIAAERRLRQFETGVEGQLEIDEVEAAEQDIVEQLTLEGMSRQARLKEKDVEVIDVKETKEVSKEELHPDEIKYNEIQAEIRDVDKKIKEEKKKMADIPGGVYYIDEATGETDIKEDAFVYQKVIDELNERKRVLKGEIGNLEAKYDEQRAEQMGEMDEPLGYDEYVAAQEKKDKKKVKLVEKKTLQQKLDDINARLEQPGTTGKLKTKLQKEKVKLEKSLEAVHPKIIKGKKKIVTYKRDPFDEKFEKTWGVEKGERPFKGAMFVSDGVTYVIDKVKSASGIIAEGMRKDILNIAEEGVSGIEDIMSKEDFEEGDLYQMYDLTQWTDKDGNEIDPEPVFGVPINALVEAGYTIVNKPGEKADPSKIISTKYQKDESSVDEIINKTIDKIKDTESPLDDLRKSLKGYEDIDFQPITKSDKVKIKENKQVAKKIVSKLKKKFPFIQANAVEKVFNEEGQEVAGRAFKNIVEWSTTQGTLDTIPHEYAHIYMKIMGDHPIIQEGKKRFGGEENLVQYIGDYYTGKIQDKGLISRLKTWLRKWTNALKNFFGVVMTDKEIADLISEKFYSFKMKESDLGALVKSKSIAYQRAETSEKVDKKIDLDGAEIEHYKNDLKDFSFDSIDKSVEWKQVTYRSGAKQPRLTNYYGDPGTDYTYSGVVNKPKKWSKELLALKKEVERITGFRFNSALVNKYRTGSDAIGWHADNEPELGDTPIIASVSFGATRVFKLQKVNPTTGKRYGEVKTFPLADSDLFLMFGNTQKNYHHSISKEVEKGARINVTFRNTTHDLLQNRAFEKPKASRQEKAVIQSKFNNMMDDIFSKVRRFAKTNNEEVNIPTFVHTAIKGFETDRKNWIPLFYKWMGQHKNEELNDIALIGSTADGESSSLFSIEDPDIDEITLKETSSLIDSVKDNDIAISEAEIDARQNIKRAVDRSLRLLGLKITEIERTNLYDAAKAKDFDEWYRDDLANLLAFKKKDIKELTHGQNDAAAQLHTFLQNRMAINRKAGGGNAINYIRFDKRWNKPQKRWQYSIKLIGPQERTYTTDYGIGIIKEQSQYDTNLIAHSKPHLSALLRGMYFLTDGMFNQIETIEDKLEGIDPYKKLLGKKSYKFLNSVEIRALENTGISFNYFTDKVDTKTGEVTTTSRKGSLQDKMVFLFSRGDSGKMVTGSINGRHLNIARNQEKWEEFWNAVEKGGYINKDQLKSYLSMTIRGVGFKFEDIAIRSRAIATFDYINSFIPGWLSRDFADVLKRIKVPLTPAFSNKRVPDAEARFIPAGRIQFSVGDGPKHNGVEKIGSLGETYEGDGNTITSKRYVKSVAKAYGIDRAIGWLKSVVYDVDPYLDDKGNVIPIDNVDMLMLKHQHSIPEVGLKIWNNNTLVGEVNRDGNIEAPDGIIIDMIMTNDEAKMREGKYVDKDDLQGIKTVKFVIPGSAFGLVKMSVGKKNTVKFPLQWMNYIQDQDLIADLVEAFTGPNSKSQQILRILMKATRDPKQIKVLADTLKSKFKEEVDTGLHNDIMASGGLIPRDAGRLEIIARGKILDPAISLDEQAGAPLYFAPNYARDLKVNELAVDINTIIKNKQLKDRFGRDNPDKPLTFENINSWLDKNDIRVLAYRSPIAYAGGVNYLRIKRLTSTNGTVQIHRNTTFLGYQGDYDGDALYVLTMPDKMNEKLKDFFESKVFTDKIKGVNLEKLKGKISKFNPMHPSDRSQMIEAMVYSNTAIQEIASTSLLFGLIRNSVVSANIKGEIIVPNTGIIDMGNGVKGDADYVLRVYLEAAVDNPKYLLLKDWKYNVTSLRKKLFKTKAGLTLDKFDVIDEKGWIKNDEWKAFNNGVLKTYGIAVNIRNLKDNEGKKDTVEGIINNSKDYATFINRRLNSTKPHRNIPDVEVTFNNNVSLLEKSVAGVYEMFDKYVDSGPKGADSRKSPLRFDAKTYEAGHMEAKSKMNIGSRLEVLRNKMGQTKFNAAQTFARGILKDAIRAMTTKETKNRRPLQPNSWEVNEDLINLRIFKLEKLLDSSKEGQEAVTLTIIKEIGNRDLDLLPPHEYLHSAVNQYYKVNNDYLRGEPTAEEISDVGLDEAKRRNCGQGL